MKTIPLSRGKFALVDDEDYEYLNQWKWHISHYGYAERTQHMPSSRANQKFKSIRMHRLIMDAPKNLQVDHIDGSRTNNVRSNLRLCLSGENTRNQKVRATSRSGYKGVSWHPGARKWMVRVGTRYFGLHDDAGEAAKVYNHWAVVLFGEFARLNDV